MIGKTILEIKIGDTAEFAKTVTESDIYLYAGVTGDFNPAHINEDYAKKTFFKTRIAHGMLSAGFISTVIGNK
ncbi:MAG: MaoC/PaaZ C-terminal domain-containing protein, partial [Desulfobacterales bacterium]